MGEKLHQPLDFGLQRAIVFGAITYLIALFELIGVPLIWDAVFRFEIEKLEIMNITVSALWIAFVGFTYLSLTNKRNILYILPGAVICFWWLIRETLVSVLWAIGGFAP